MTANNKRPDTQKRLNHLWPRNAFIGINSSENEERYVPSSFSLEFIPMKALRGQRWLRRFWVSGRLLLAVIQSYRYIRRLRPDVVLGMGGYVSAPAGIAAWLARVPLIIHEQNAVAGLG